MIHHTADPKVAVAEVTYRCRSVDGRDESIPAVLMVRVVRDGLIVESHDHVAVAQATGSLPTLLSARTTTA
ncbi:MAG: hypothetical protein S0880_03915 [Actinomycetota bacterium]|nr:hypothetical protein [Actinomycetota bacterium]